MIFRRLAVFFLLWCLWALPLPAADRYMPVDEVRAGMVGIGRTVFRGDVIEEFKVHILGVLRRTISPQRDLILARLEGGPLAETGVIAGMSGSPVYIDGRMIGAVAYSLGSFPTAAIAGITPIGEMLDAGRVGGSRTAGAPMSVPGFITADTWRSVLRAMPSRMRPFASSPNDTRVLTPGQIDASMATALRPIATPVSLGGLSAEAAAPLIDAFAQAGFVTTPASGTQTSPSPAAGAAPMRPGAAVGVTLVSGDYTVGATGTVTEVDGDRVYAFGHPFFGMGPARLPMTRAFVHAILPSLSSSTKIASTGEVIGAFTQDRSTVVAGALGKGPDLIPLRISLTNQYGQRREIRASLIEDLFFTPLLGFVTVGSAISAHERDLGANTYTIRGRIAVRGLPPITFDDVVAGESAVVTLGSMVSVPLAILLANDREPVTFDAIDVTIESSEQVRTASIERVWLDAVDVRPGRTVPLKILLRTYRGADDVRTVPIEIPAHVEGPLTIVVADGARLTQHEERDGRMPAPAASIAQLAGQLARIKRGNRVYVRVYTRDAGAMVAGEPLPALPNSVLSVLESDRAGSGTSQVGSATVGSFDFALDRAVTGIRTLTVTPVPFARRP